MIDLDTDPRLTAYALDELDRDEREIFEQDLANADVDPSEFIAEIKALAQMLDEVYASEPALRMTDQQRDALLINLNMTEEEERAVGVESSKPPLRLRVHWSIVATAIAACFVAISAFIAVNTDPDRPAMTSETVLVSNAESPPTGSNAPLEGGALPAVVVEEPRTKAIEVLAKNLAQDSVLFDYEMNSLRLLLLAENSVVEPDDFGVVGNFGMGLGFGDGRVQSGGGSAVFFGTNDVSRRGRIYRGDGATSLYSGAINAGTTGNWDDSRALTDSNLYNDRMLAEDASQQESYAKIFDNPFEVVLEGENQLSTFSIDVDTASYANVRRMLRAGQKPPAAAVRIEEMVNYFKYDYPHPGGEHPFSANLEVASCPWTKGNRLVRIGLKGRETETEERPDSNLVFLIDVSGSMQSADKLSLLKASMMELAKNLREQDSVSIVAYAGSSGLVLDATSGALQDEIQSAIGRLEAGGSTNGGAGIKLAYRVATENFIKGGVNRVILATDGDFNVGITNHDDLVKTVADRAKENVYLTVLGFGSGNLKDDLIEEISNRGNGNSFYIDSAREGHKVLVEEMGSTLETIAKDVKIQVEFNPAHVRSYRLIGYENRMLRNRDFNDDKIDAGEVGAGHAVTALYEIVPVGVSGKVDELKYGVKKKPAKRKNVSPEMMTVKMRYKQPEGDKSVKFDAPLVDAGKRWEESSGDFRFAASVAGFGMLLRDSQHKGELNFELVKELAGEGIGEDPKGYRKEFLELVDLAK